MGTIKTGEGVVMKVIVALIVLNAIILGVFFFSQAKTIDSPHRLTAPLDTAQLGPHLVSEAIAKGDISDPRAQEDMRLSVRLHVIGWNGRAKTKDWFKQFAGDKKLMAGKYRSDLARELRRFRKSMPELNLDVEKRVEAVMAIAMPIFDDLYPTQQASAPKAERRRSSSGEQVFGSVRRHSINAMDSQRKEVLAISGDEHRRIVNRVIDRLLGMPFNSTFVVHQAQDGNTGNVPARDGDIPASDRAMSANLKATIEGILRAIIRKKRFPEATIKRTNVIVVKDLEKAIALAGLPGIISHEGKGLALDRNDQNSIYVDMEALRLILDKQDTSRLSEDQLSPAEELFYHMLSHIATPINRNETSDEYEASICQRASLKNVFEILDRETVMQHLQEGNPLNISKYPVLVKSPWGVPAVRSRILRTIGMDTRPSYGQLGISENEPIGEFWIACDERRDRGKMSFVTFKNGTVLPLYEVLEMAGEMILGREHREQYGDRIGVLMKLLNSIKPLSAQFHAKEGMLGPEGRVMYDPKPEAWKLKRGSGSFIGFENDVTEEELAREFWKELYAAEMEKSPEAGLRQLHSDGVRSFGFWEDALEKASLNDRNVSSPADTGSEIMDDESYNAMLMKKSEACHWNLTGEHIRILIAIRKIYVDKKIGERRNFDRFMNYVGTNDQLTEMLVDVPGGVIHAIGRDSLIMEWSLPDTGRTTQSLADTVGGNMPRPGKHGNLKPCLEILRHATGCEITTPNPANVFKKTDLCGPTGVLKEPEPVYATDVHGNYINRLFATSGFIVEQIYIAGGESNGLFFDTGQRGMCIYIDEGDVAVLDKNGVPVLELSKGAAAVIPACMLRYGIVSLSHNPAAVYRWYAPLKKRDAAILSDKRTKLEGVAPRTAGGSRTSSSGANQAKKEMGLQEALRVVNETCRTVETRRGALDGAIAPRPMTIFVHQDLMRGELFKAEKTAFSFDNGLTIRLFSGMDSIPANFNRDTDVIVTTQEELSRIASGVMKVDPKITSSARMLGVETDRSEGHPFLREILVSAILLGSLDESDIREKSATYESFRTIVGLLKGREISAEEVKGLIMASGIEPGAIVDRAKRILRLLITKPMVKFDTEAVKTERQVLWAA